MVAETKAKQSPAFAPKVHESGSISFVQGYTECFILCYHVGRQVMGNMGVINGRIG